MAVYESDKKYINKDTLTNYCNTNEHLIVTPVKGFVIELPGLDGNSCMGGNMTLGKNETGVAQELAAHGILHAYAFPGPWSWMNKGARRLVDGIVDAIKEIYHLGENAPWMVMGGSMGGLGALMYTCTAKTKPTACIAVCPCTDVVKSFDVITEFPRTFIRAISDYDMPFEEGLKTLSPIEHLGEMPDIPYLIINDCADELFPEEELDVYVEKLKEHVSNVEYDKLKGCIHGEITVDEWHKIIQFLITNLSK